MAQPYMMVNGETVFYCNPQGVKFAWEGHEWYRVDAFPDDAVEAGTGDALPEIPDDIYNAKA